MKKFIIMLLTCTLALGFLSASTDTAAKTIKELQEEQRQLRAKEKEAETRLSELRSEKNTLTNEIIALNIEIELSEDQLTYIHNRLDTTRDELERTTAELKEAEELRENHYEALKKRLRYIHESGNVGYIQVLFNSKSIGDFLNRAEYVNDIVLYDQNMYARLEEIEVSISDKRDLIEQQLREIEVLAMQEEEKILELEQAKDARTRVMEDIESDESKYNQMVAMLSEESDAIGKKIKQAQEEAEKQARAAAAAAAARKAQNYSSGTGVPPSGQFSWPVPGYYNLSSGYKNRVSPITGRPEFHTGIDIPAPRGTSIVAAEAGTVILAGSNGGYGICVVIDHGNGVSTLYGHNSSLLVSVGDRVSKGQTIAKCGSTGMSTGNHCHFEVRINGSPTSPGGYVGL